MKKEGKGEREGGLTWIDQQTAPRVPRTLAAIGTSIFLMFAMLEYVGV